MFDFGLINLPNCIINWCVIVPKLYKLHVEYRSANINVNLVSGTGVSVSSAVTVNL